MAKHSLQTTLFGTIVPEKSYFVYSRPKLNCEKFVERYCERNCRPDNRKEALIHNAQYEDDSAFHTYACMIMDISKDSLDDEILLQTDDPTITNGDIHEPPTPIPASGPKPVPSPTSNLPIGDLALMSPTQERGKGQPCKGARLNQEPGDLQPDRRPNPSMFFFEGGGGVEI